MHDEPGDNSPLPGLCLTVSTCQEATRLVNGCLCLQLPVYVPSPEEQADPKLYANNVRKYMVRQGVA